ncbi:MAG: hypothetical protein NTX97_13370 [Bacteroidetes bacterium]|nr:hypothetical protein [Bacteroidota bacterium]
MGLVFIYKGLVAGPLCSIVLLYMYSVKNIPIQLIPIPIWVAYVGYTIQPLWGGMKSPGGRIEDWFLIVGVGIATIVSWINISAYFFMCAFIFFTYNIIKRLELSWDSFHFINKHVPNWTPGFRLGHPHTSQENESRSKFHY